MYSVSRVVSPEEENIGQARGLGQEEDPSLRRQLRQDLEQVGDTEGDFRSSVR